MEDALQTDVLADQKVSFERFREEILRDYGIVCESREASLLGSLLIDGDSFIKIVDQIQAEDFYDEKHRMIYSAMSSLYNKRSPIDNRRTGSAPFEDALPVVSPGALPAAAPAIHR